MKCANRKRQLKPAAAAAAVAAACAMAVFPAMALDSAKNGVALWADTVLPALLPFFICANFMIGLGVPAAVGRVFCGLFQSLFGVSGKAAFVFAISVTSGYPMGAQLTGELCRKGEITPDDGKGMLAFCTTSGPLFILGTVGAGMFHSMEAGLVIAVSHYVGAVLNGIVWRPRRRAVKQGKAVPVSEPARDCGLLDLLTESIMKSLKTVGVICCYLILFTMLIDFLQFAGLFRFAGNGAGSGILKGLLEMTVGCNALSSSDSGASVRIAAAAMLISFGGLSVAAQSASALRGSGIRPVEYLMRKVTHGILAGGIALLLVYLHPVLPSVEAGAFGGEASLPVSPGYLASLLFSTEAMAVIAGLLIVFSFAGKRKR